MDSDREVTQLYHLIEEPRTCSYLPAETASLEYRILREIAVPEYERWLEHGWRRQGMYFFRPQCPACQQCRPLRVDVQNFRPTKSQRRALNRNADVTLVVQPASITQEQIELFNAWHADMSVRSGWPESTTTVEGYARTFLLGEWSFASEFLYYDDGKLVGVGLIDELPESLSSVYFYHDPAWRPRSPGTFTALKEIEYAQQTGRRWLYLGYWIADCQSMAYKNRFGPHQLLEGYPELDEPPRWQAPDEADNSEEHRS